MASSKSLDWETFSRFAYMRIKRISRGGSLNRFSCFIVTPL